MNANEMGCKFCKPLLFNCWKHHLNFIKQQISGYSISEDFGKKPPELSLITIGNSVTDIYTGHLSIPEINLEMMQFVRLNNLNEKKNFIKWLHDEGRDYKQVKLSDESLWTLRMSDDEKRFVHVHPARNIALTIRVKASTLKTAILVLIMSAREHKNPEDLEYINTIRKKYFSLPPVKSAVSAGKLFKLISFLKAELTSQKR